MDEDKERHRRGLPVQPAKAALPVSVAVPDVPTAVHVQVRVLRLELVLVHTAVPTVVGHW